MPNFHHLGSDGDDDYLSSAPANPLTPDVAEALSGLDIPVPQVIGEALGAAGAEHLELTVAPAALPRWRVPTDGPQTVPEELAAAAREAGITVVNSDEDLRLYVEARGYALVPLDKLGDIQITENGPRLKEFAISRAPFPDDDHDPLEEAVEATPVGINPKDAIGLTKPNLALIPPAGSLYQAQAMMDGAAKYGAYNWRSNPVLMMVYIAAAQRHLAQLLDGEDFDPLSGCHHVGHAMACLGIIADARETGNLVDDRPVKGPAGAMIRHFGETRDFQRPVPPILK